MKLRWIVILIVLVAVVAGVGWFAARGPLARLLTRSVDALESWCGTQLIAIADDHLGPKLSFDDLDYVFPRAVLLTGIRLTAEGETIIAADSILIDFAEVPTIGKPIVIQKVDAKSPVIRLIKRDDRLLGFDRFVNSQGGRTREDGGSTRLSDVLAIEKIIVRKGAVHYEKPGRPVMRLQPLTFELEHEPIDQEKGWYDFAAKLNLLSVANVEIDARINMDTAVLDVHKAILRQSLSEAQYEIFTPEIQEVLRDHEIKGDLDWFFSGQVPLRNMIDSTFETQLHLTDASIAFGDYVLPVRSLNVSGRMSGRMLEVSDLTIKALGGSAQATYRQWLDAPRAGQFEGDGQGHDLRVEQALRHPDQREGADLGDFGFTLHVSGNYDELAESFTGHGEITATDARLRIVGLFRGFAGLAGNPKHDDHGRTDYELTPDRVKFTGLVVSGTMVGISGDIDLYYDGRLDGVANAGPLQGRRGVAGVLGDAFGIVTKRMVAYRIEGTIQDPAISVRPFALGTKKKD